MLSRNGNRTNFESLTWKECQLPFISYRVIANKNGNLIKEMHHYYSKNDVTWPFTSNSCIVEKSTQTEIATQQF